jgi:hypothetical protein
MRSPGVGRLEMPGEMAQMLTSAKRTQFDPFGRDIVAAICPSERHVRSGSPKNQILQIKANSMNGIKDRGLWQSQFKPNPKPISQPAPLPAARSDGDFWVSA